jgi:N-methylhydantoinase A
LSVELARQAIGTQIAKPLGLTVEEAAAAIYTVQNAQTGDLLRKTVVEAGHDPREFVLYAYGGAGPAHCAQYATEIGVGEVVVPLGPVASAFSAFGLASSNVVLAAELSNPLVVPFDPALAERTFAELEQRVRDGLARQHVRFETVELHREIDMRYAMQLAEVTAPVRPGPLDVTAIEEATAAFEQRYATLFGKDTGFREAGVQAITFRVRGTGVLPFSPELPQVPPADSTDPSSARTGTRPVCLDAGTGYADTAIYDYRPLRAGHVLPGPAIVEVPTTTVVVPSGATATVDRLGNLIIRTAVTARRAS